MILIEPATPLIQAQPGGTLYIRGKNMNTYNKHLLSIDMQIEAYKEAKMIIDSPEEVRWALENIGYYRLRGYSFQFYDNKTKTYEDGTSFSNIIKLYKFDVELSHLLFAMISKIEVSVRARLIDAMLVYKDALIWRNPIIYSKEKIFYKNLSVISSEINRSSDVFIKHHLEKYDGNIPIWAVVEIMSFGTLSKVIKILNQEKIVHTIVWQNIINIHLRKEM